MNDAGSLRRCAVALGILAAICFVGGVGMAELAAQPPRAAAARDSAESSRRAETFDEAEAAAKQLVGDHLPQLAALLKTLRKNSPEQYHEAIADLARQARRLEASRRRSPELYELELAILKRQTRVDLSVAKLQLRDTPEAREQLRAALEDLQQARRARLLYEREQLEHRRARLEQHLQTVEERLESPASTSPQWVDKVFRSLVRKAGRSAEPANPSAADGDSTAPAENPSR